MILYHFPTSPFARRVRLALSHKGLSAELRDARANPLVDSNAICHYLDRKFPAPPLWPAGLAGAEAFEFIALTDSVTTTLIDLGLRYHAVHGDPNFVVVKEEMVGRAQRALELLAEKVTSRGAVGVPLCGEAWSGADMAVYTTVTWLEGLPGRAATIAPAKQIVALGWSLPSVLGVWAAQYHGREDVRALG
jgi:glutathione S-transferase